MYRSALIAGLGLLLASLPLQATELKIELVGGKPTQHEFERACKRALFRRSYDIRSIDRDVVIGEYREQIEMAFILTDDSIVIRNTENGGRDVDTIKKFLRHLKREVTHDLADYTLAASTDGDPARALALVESVKLDETIDPSDLTSHVIVGRYQSRISSENLWVFNKESQRNLVITFEQDGNDLTGYNESVDMKISGTIDGDEVRFFTWPSDVTSYELKGTWKIEDDARRLTGKWTQGHGGGDWDLTRIE